MSKGCFIVREDPQEKLGILYILREDRPCIPVNQLWLRQEVEQTKLLLIRIKNRNKTIPNPTCRVDVEPLFQTLLGVAREGLVGTTANQVLARQELCLLKSTIINALLLRN